MYKRRAGMKDLSVCRQEIDEIDRQITGLFEKRMLVAADVAEYKRMTGKAVFDKAREDEKLATLEQMASNPYFGSCLPRLCH